MRISSSDTLAGYPIVRIRNLLAKGRSGDLVVEQVERFLHVNQKEARRVLDELVQRDYLELIDEFLPHEQWQTTETGNALAGATAARPVKRATAEQRLAEFMARVEALNANDDYLYRVSKVVLFGSMLGDSSTVGDIDVGIQLMRRHPSDEWEVRRDQRVKVAIAAGVSFHTLMKQFMWPYQETLLFLRSRSHVLSLHEFDEVERLKTAYCVLFETDHATAVDARTQVKSRRRTRR